MTYANPTRGSIARKPNTKPFGFKRYLDRLKQLDNGEIFHHTPKPEPTKPTEPPFDGFVGSIPGANENIRSENDTDEIGNGDDLIFQKVTTPLPTKPSKGIEADYATTFWHWLIHFADREPMEVYFNPDASFDKVMAGYPDALAAEPIPERIAPA